MNLRRTLSLGAAALTLGSTLAVGGAAVTAQAAEAVPYKIARGTWGGLCSYGVYDRHVRYERHAGNVLVEKRHYAVARNWYDGKRWVCSQQVNRYYYRTVA